MLCELDKLIENHAFELKNCKKHLASLNKPDYEDLIEKGDLETKSGEQILEWRPNWWNLEKEALVKLCNDAAIKRKRAEIKLEKREKEIYAKNEEHNVKICNQEVQINYL